jgi:hypothetical protein
MWKEDEPEQPLQEYDSTKRNSNFHKVPSILSQLKCIIPTLDRAQHRLVSSIRELISFLESMEDDEPPNQNLMDDSGASTTATTSTTQPAESCFTTTFFNYQHAMHPLKLHANAVEKTLLPVVGSFSKRGEYAPTTAFFSSRLRMGLQLIQFVSDVLLMTIFAGYASTGLVEGCSSLFQQDAWVDALWSTSTACYKYSRAGAAATRTSAIAYWCGGRVLGHTSTRHLSRVGLFYVDFIEIYTNDGVSIDGIGFGG